MSLLRWNIEATFGRKDGGVVISRKRLFTGKGHLFRNTSDRHDSLDYIRGDNVVSFQQIFEKTKWVISGMYKVPKAYFKRFSCSFIINEAKLNNIKEKRYIKHYGWYTVYWQYVTKFSQLPNYAICTLDLIGKTISFWLHEWKMGAHVGSGDPFASTRSWVLMGYNLLVQLSGVFAVTASLGMWFF